VIGSSSIARTATSSRVFSLRSPMSAMTNTEAIAPVGRAIRSRSFARCAPLGLKTVRYRCVSRATTGRREEHAGRRDILRRTLQGRRRGPCRLLFWSSLEGRAAGLWPHVPDAVLRPDPQRGACRHHRGRRHFGGRSRELDRRGRVAPNLCAIARPHLADPAWTLHEAAKIGVADIAWPRQYFSAQGAYEANSHGRRRRRLRRHDRQISQRPSCAGDRRGKRHRRGDGRSLWLGPALA